MDHPAELLSLEDLLDEAETACRERWRIANDAEDTQAARTLEEIRGNLALAIRQLEDLAERGKPVQHTDAELPF